MRRIISGPIPVNLTWDEQKAKLLSTFPVLSDEDLKCEAGKKYALITSLCEKLGVSRKELIVIMNSI